MTTPVALSQKSEDLVEWVAAHLHAHAVSRLGADYVVTRHYLDLPRGSAFEITSAGRIIRVSVELHHVEPETFTLPEADDA